MKLNEILARVLRLTEADADGDRQFVTSGLSELAADLTQAVSARGPSTCPECGDDFRWPGLCADHMRVAHPAVWEERYAA